MNYLDEILSKDESQVNMMSPLTWAYVGDSVYELYIRVYLANTTNLNPHRMHVESIKYVKAGSQAKAVKELIEINFLTDDEREIVRRGRNTQNHHLPKNASLEDYSYSTGFEALIGYLFLNKNEKRIKEIIKKVVEEKLNEN